MTTQKFHTEVRAGFRSAMTSPLVWTMVALAIALDRGWALID